jgi:hypothetical protein
MSISAKESYRLIQCFQLNLAKHSVRYRQTFTESVIKLYSYMKLEAGLENRDYGRRGPSR